MSATLEPEAIELLLENVASEEDARFLSPGEITDAAGTLPQPWIEMLAANIEPAKFVERWWAPVQDRLPETVQLLKQKTSCLVLLATRQKPLSLVYCFGTDKGLFANRGFLPVSDARSINRRDLPVELGALYQIHDGWLDFFSSDDGLLPINEWRMLGSKTGTPPFLEIYLNGNTSMGFDMSSRPARAFSLLPDEEIVEPVGDIWAWLDEAFAAGLEDIADASSDDD